MLTFFTEIIAKSPLFRSPNRVSSLDLLEPVTRAAVVAIMTESKAAGMPLILFETYRSQERQERLFEQGATQLRTAGTHHFGVSADLVKDINGDPSWKGSFDFLGVLAKKHGLVWGGDWNEPGKKHSFIDADHLQRCRVIDQPKLFGGAWYPPPDQTYNPVRVQ